MSTQTGLAAWASVDIPVTTELISQIAEQLEHESIPVLTKCVSRDDITEKVSQVFVYVVTKITMPNDYYW